MASRYCLYYLETDKNQHEFKSNTHCACLIPFVKLFALCTGPAGTVHTSFAF